MSLKKPNIIPLVIIILSLLLFLFIISSLSGFIKFNNTNTQALISERMGESVKLLDIEKGTEDINVLFISVNNAKVGVAHFTPHQFLKTYYTLSSSSFSDEDLVKNIDQNGATYFIQIGGYNPDCLSKTLNICFNDSFTITEEISNQGYFMKIYRLSNEARIENIFIK